MASNEVSNTKLATPTPATAEARCEQCDGTGDVHRADGEWLGPCKCRQATAEAPPLPEQEPVPDGVWEALQRMIESTAVLGPASQEDALLVARYRRRLLTAQASPSLPAERDKHARKLINDFARACVYGSDDERRTAGDALLAALAATTPAAAQPAQQPAEDCETRAELAEQELVSAIEERDFLRERVQALEAQTAAARDVLAERRRQVEVEGWWLEHDDAHNDGAMAIAAACYTLSDRRAALDVQTVSLRALWLWTGWAEKWFKPKDRRSNLVRAGALILAELERLDRTSTQQQQDGGKA